MRRTSSALLLVATVALGGCGTMADPSEWFEGDSGPKPAELAKIQNQIQVQTLWSRDIGAGTDDQRLQLIPRVVAGRVYVADSDGDVKALDAETGRLLWEHDTELPLSGGPGSGNGLVLVGTSDAELLALDEETGEERWRARVSSEVLSVPSAGLGVAVVHTIDGKLAGLDAATGEQKWLYSHDVPVLTLRGGSSPVISGSSVICGLAGGKVVALNLDTGVLQWEVSITPPTGRTELDRMVDIDGDPLLRDGAVFVSTYQGELAAVGETTGMILWRRKLSSYRSLAANWQYLYASDENGEVWAVEGGNGAAAWKQSDLKYRSLSAPAVLGEYLVVGDEEGYLHWLSTSDGHFVARTRVGSDPISAQPVSRDGVLYVYGEGGSLAALRIAE